MLVCPFCAADDLIEGEDVCPHCQQSLADAFIRVPASSVEADLLHELVGDLPGHDPLVLPATSTVGDALAAMTENRVGCVLIVVEGKLAGIFSERDALMRLGPEGVSLHDEPIVKYMTPNPAVLSADDKIAFAIHRMDLGGYRHLPVMDGDRAISVISVRDVLRYITEHDTGVSA